MKKQRRDVTLKGYAKVLREHGEKYSGFMNDLADTLDGIAEVFSIQGTALRYIYENAGHEFEFPKLEEDNNVEYGMKVDSYPKEGDNTKWTIRLGVEFVNLEEVEDD